ncbi:hypothetical protein GCM10009641_74710 [Mycobacterium cookii]|jgi:hypothetical protein|uniref:Uncharacterized protein n=1 Tax=Nocardioides furvisabuli TaxID=375542 RepID=A0ABP5IID7_9ACTN|nr:hypothetical protein [Nocardioides furvisabuli]
MVADRWGVDGTERGKQVWAELSGRDDVATSPPARLRNLQTASRPSHEDLPPGWVMVRLAQCPVELILQQDRHLDELVRELQLLSVDRGSPHSAALADEIRGLLVSPTHARLTGRRAAELARDEDKEVVDVDMAMPREFSSVVEQLQIVIARADQLCRRPAPDARVAAGRSGTARVDDPRDRRSGDTWSNRNAMGGVAQRLKLALKPSHSESNRGRTPGPAKVCKSRETSGVERSFSM